jgi:hypothetical protein
MASEGISETDFDDPHRLALLKTLKEALGVSGVAPIIWACLWLSDISILEDLVHAAQANKIRVLKEFSDFKNAKVVHKCEFTALAT